MDARVADRQLLPIPHPAGFAAFPAGKKKKWSVDMLIRSELSDILTDLMVNAAGFGFAVATIFDLISFSVWGLLGMVKKLATAK